MFLVTKPGTDTNRSTACGREVGVQGPPRSYGNLAHMNFVDVQKKLCESSPEQWSSSTNGETGKEFGFGERTFSKLNMVCRRFELRIFGVRRTLIRILPMLLIWL